MGFFGTYLYHDGHWSTRDSDEHVTVPAPWLLVDIYDSDITTLAYCPTGSGTGTAYLGETPRTYFANEAASPPTDVEREADGLAQWWAGLRPAADDADIEAKRQEVTGYLAADEDPGVMDFDDEDEFEDEPERDDADIFVEIKTARFLSSLGLPVPVDLRR